jgi:WD40 repeat protein
MSDLRRQWLLVVSLTFLVCRPAWGGQLKDPAKPAPAEKKSVGNDLYGDPLPGGAVARLGTVRFRVGEYLSGAALSPDGKILAMVSGRQQIHLLDPATGKEVRKWKIGDPTGSQFLAFSPDGKTLGTVGHLGRIALYSVPAGDLLRYIGTGGRSRLASFAFSADGKVLVSGGEGFREKVTATAWDVATGKQLAVFEAEHNQQLSVAVSADGKTVATYGQVQRHFPRGKQGDEAELAGTIQLWSVAGKKELRRIKTGHGYTSYALFSPDGKTLATLCGYDGAIGVWDVATGKPIRRFGCLQDVSFLAFSGDGKFLAGGSRQSAVIQLWETATGKRLPLCRGPECAATSVAFTGPGKILACGVNNQAAYLWEVPSGKPLSPTKGHAGAVTSLAFSADGKTVLSASSGGTVCRWESATGKELGHFTLRVHDERMRHFYWHGNTSLLLSPDGRHAVMGSRHVGPAMLWDVASREEVCTLGYRKGGGEEMAYAFSADGKLLALGGGDRFGRRQEAVVIIWDVDTCQELRRLKGHQGGIVGLAFSLDGILLASSSGSIGRTAVSELFLWDVRSGKKRGEIKQDNTGQHALALSADGMVLAVAGNQGVTLWDTATVKQMHALDTGTDYQSPSLAFSPDTRTLAMATTNRVTNATTLSLWEVASGKRRCQFQGHRGSISALRFSPDGRLLASGSGDTTILLWDVTGRTWSGVPAKAKLAEKELAELWTDLAKPEARDGFAAEVKLAAAGQDTVAFLAKELRPEAPPKIDAAGIARRIADLNDAHYKVRRKATRELEQLGMDARPALLRALQGKPSAEVRRRVEKLLAKAETARLRVDPLLLRSLRALEVLERIASPEAKKVVLTLAKGNPQARLTQEAKAALDRLQTRKQTRP